MIALIPARSGSKRIPGKNIRNFFGHPLIAYTIQSAIDSKIFDGIYVSSDSDEIGKIAEYYGAKWIKRPEEFARDNSPDLEWIDHALKNISCNVFMILRPTNPFRTYETITRAYTEWDGKHCMKAIQKVSEHPGKMWKVLFNDKTLMQSFLGEDLHLLPTQSLEQYYIQNACIEIRPTKSMDGTDYFYQPFFTYSCDYEGFDLNAEEDWILAEVLVEKGLATLTKIGKEKYKENREHP